MYSCLQGKEEYKIYSVTNYFFFKAQEDSGLQRKYRFIKSRLIALEMNTEAFLKICTPDQEIWRKFGWRGKKVIEIITQIIENGLPTL